VGRLLQQYLKIDIQRQNQITKAEFWCAMGVKPTRFSDKVFEMVSVRVVVVCSMVSSYRALRTPTCY
jgi:hypothetical protein